MMNAATPSDGALRKICVVTGTRAEYGLLYWLMKELKATPNTRLQIVATCMHLSPEFGHTVAGIEADGFVVDEKVEMLLSSDTSVGAAKSTGLGMIGFADAFSRLAPDIVVLLGDRFEALAVASTCLLLKIPVAHLCGGELTLGAFDDAIRHSITKMAALHFVTHPEYGRRVRQLGEDPRRVFDVGSISAENLQRLPLLSRSDLERALGIQLGGPTFLVTYHPATLATENPTSKVDELVAALESTPDATVVFTLPNADPASRLIRDRLLAAVASHPCRWHAFDSLGTLKYLSLMSHCDVVVGNSSSGILEAPVLGTPTVNIGSRQKGRVRQASIVDCEEGRNEIQTAVSQAREPGFRKLSAEVAKGYVRRFPSVIMAQRLRDCSLEELRFKGFVDVAFEDPR